MQPMEGEKPQLSRKRITVEQNGEVSGVVQHIWATFGLVAFKTIFNSFGAVSIFRDLWLTTRDRRKNFEWL